MTTCSTASSTSAACRTSSRAKVELDAVLQPGGFGGVKMTGRGAARSASSAVERAYEGSGASYDCVNRRFFDCADDGPEGIRAFDLRDI